ncbi:hypothetical protein OIO90_004064 [Microbotryomycetes sp. JL221]|nr:hypothetical protein OIO90_004064 [Microbotryomycetes sp. JL221]
MSTFKVVFVGAGEINFGSPEGPWNHSLRVERTFGAKLQVCGIIDPDTDRARNQIKSKRQANIPGWDDATVWQSPEQAAAQLGEPMAKNLDLVIVGAPPHFRGCALAPANLDLRLIDSLAANNWLVEKPVSAAQPSLDAGLDTVLRRYQDTQANVGVGYMMCALKAVDQMRQMIQQRDLKVVATNARYYMAYEHATKPAWWNKHKSCGPVVEQATHLASLSLLFGGEANLASVRTHTVEHDDTVGELTKLSFDEAATIPSASRIPRYTSSVFKYKSGAIGTLTHWVGLEGTTYDTEFEVLCTRGVAFRLADIYTSKPRLFIRKSGENTQVESHEFENDDPFQTQLDRLVAGDPACTYEQALQTYELTWAIRLAGETEVSQR